MITYMRILINIIISMNRVIIMTFLRLTQNFNLKCFEKNVSLTDFFELYIKYTLVT